MRVIYIVIFFLCFGICYGQKIDTLKLRTALIVHADFEDFTLDRDNNSFSSIASNYTIELLKCEKILDCLFFKISFKDTARKCAFYVAFDQITESFFRLRGFKSSEFNDFANLVLLSGHINFPASMKNKNATQFLKYAEQNVKIEGIDLHNYFDEYYSKPLNALFDKYSCYRKTHLTEYKK